MVLKNNFNNRLLIYFFYDKDGVVDDYITYMLKHMKPYVKDIIFVSNGDLAEDSRKKVIPLCDHIIERENKGMDVMAYKAAIDYKGWDKLAEYDEMIMMNFTIMGPVSSFNEMFDDMDRRDVDFWGLTIFHGCDGDPFGCNCEYGYLPLHIQSHFIAVRNNMIKSDDFHKYWDERPEIKYYSDAVGKHEAIFTKKFADMGYKWDVYSDTRDMLDYTDLPIISMPVKLIRDLRCPIFKRRNFFQEYFDILNKSTGEVERELYEYLQKHTDYDVNMIWDNMLRVQNIADIKKALQLNYVLSSKAVTSDVQSDERLKYILFVSDKKNLLNNFGWVEKIQQYASFVIYCDSQETECAFKQNIKTGEKCVYIVSDKIKDAVERVLMTKAQIEDSDIICFINDFRDSSLKFDSINESYLYRAHSSLVCNEIYVKNIINLFAENERLGLLTIPTPNHADYYPTCGCFDWGDNFDETVKLAEYLGINSNINITKEPVAAYGHMFYARATALKKVFNEKLADYEKEEKTEFAIERLYAYSVQDAGLYSATVMSDYMAEIEITNLQYMITELNRQSFALFGVDTHFELVNKMHRFLGVFGECDSSSIEIRLLRIVRKIIPRRIIGKVCRGIIGIFRRGNKE